MVERRDLSTERMVPATKCTGFFQRKNVSGLFCDAQQFSRTRRVGADLADFSGSKKSAQITGMNRLTRIRDRARNLLRLIAPRAHHPECNPLRRARTDSRHLSQLHNQIPDRRRIFGLSQHVLESIPSAIASVAG